MNITRTLAVAVLLLGLAGVVIGGVFVGMGISKSNDLKEAMQEEQITLGIEGEDLEGGVIDSMGEAMAAGDIIREHRRGIATTYSELLGEGRYNPEDPTQLSYAQALNLENYLYLAVVAFGLTQATAGSGAFMIIAGLALMGTGTILYRLPRT